MIATTRDRSERLVFRGLVADFLSPEILAMAVKELGTSANTRLDTLNSFHRDYFLHIIGILGNRTYFVVAERWLENTSEIKQSVQVRDIAVSVLILLRGQDCIDYGFNRDFEEEFLVEYPNRKVFQFSPKRTANPLEKAKTPVK